MRDVQEHFHDIQHTVARWYTTACRRKKLAQQSFASFREKMRSHFPKALLLTVIALSLNPLVLTLYLSSII